MSSQASTRLFCTTMGRQDPLATERTEPDEYNDDTGEAVYSCRCGRRHRFLWGPPAPLYLGDAPPFRSVPRAAGGG